MWQQDGLAVTRGEWLGAEKRRVTDRSGASLAPREAQEQAATTCIYCGMEDDSGHVCSVDLLKRRILELQAENAHLRDSALSFGDLAERLNQRMAADTANRNRPTMAPLKSPDGRAEG